MFAVHWMIASDTLTEATKKALSKAKKAAHRGHDPSQDSQDAANKKGELRIRLPPFTFSSLRWRLFAVAAHQSEDKGLDAPLPKDDDPEGVKMVLADDPLDRAAKFLETLKEFGKQSMDVCCVSFDVALRRSESYPMQHQNICKVLVQKSTYKLLRHLCVHIPWMHNIRSCTYVSYSSARQVSPVYSPSFLVKF